MNTKILKTHQYHYIRRTLVLIEEDNNIRALLITYHLSHYMNTLKLKIKLNIINSKIL